jgi:CBS domain-containing protein
MKPVSQLLLKRDSSVFQVNPEMTVFEGLQELARHGVGAMLVMQDGKLVGIFSERDYTRKIALEGKNSHDVKIGDIMTSQIVSVTPATGTRVCMTLMSQKRIRHLPVVHGDKVLGLISIRDIMDDIIADHEQTIADLQSYISG